MLGSVRELIGMQRLLFGSDFPFAPDLMVHAETRDLAEPGLSDVEHMAVAFGNARALFGNLASA